MISISLDPLTLVSVCTQLKNYNDDDDDDDDGGDDDDDDDDNKRSVMFSGYSARNLFHNHFDK